MNLCILIGTFTSAIFFFFCFSYLFRTQNECRSVFSAVLECHFNIKKKYIECSFANEFIATTIKKKIAEIYTQKIGTIEEKDLSLSLMYMTSRKIYNLPHQFNFCARKYTADCGTVCLGWVQWK